MKATVSAQSIVVAGEVEGDCQAEQRVHIEATGRLTGNIRAPRVVIVEGRHLQGQQRHVPAIGQWRRIAPLSHTLPPRAVVAERELSFLLTAV